MRHGLLAQSEACVFFGGCSVYSTAGMIYEAVIHEDLPLAERDEAARLKRRDPAALAAMVSRYQHRLYRYLVRLVREPAAADDLFQQTWLHAVREIRRYDSGRSFDTWLFAIAHNTAIDLLRRRAVECLEDYPASTPDALDTLLAGERAEHLAAAMDALPALYREVLTLRFEEGMKLEEIAAVTHAPLSTVKSRVQRGLEALRRSLP
jgi:RNA polymerase sigma-70 factor, ECF subfamily